MASTPALPVVCLMGPTATGKSDLAIALRRRLPVEIVSVDSAMVYRGMNIGTAKPGPEVLAQAPHRLIDVADPAQAYSAARFRGDATREIEHILAAGRIPLLVGGTMLYFAALVRGLTDLPPADPGVRADIDAEAERIGWAALHTRLKAADPQSAARIHPNDSQRIQRALEILELTGRSRSEWYRDDGGMAAPWPLLRFALMAEDRDALHARIATRFHAMMAAGFLDEVAALHARPDLDAGKSAMRAVGYRQLWAHLDGRCDLKQAVSAGIVATRQLAKRQITWLRREENLARLRADDPDVLSKILNKLVKAGVSQQIN